MRLFKLTAAIGLMVSGIGVATLATAQQSNVRIQNQADYNRHVLGIPDGSNPNVRDNRRYDRSDRRDNNNRDYDRRYNRSDRRDVRNDNRYDRRDQYHSNKKCKQVWRDNRRVRVCK